jgi:hypothetical protein
VAKSRESWPTLFGSTAQIPHPVIHALHRTRLRQIIGGLGLYTMIKHQIDLPDAFFASNCTFWYRCLPLGITIHAASSQLRMPILRSFLRLPLYVCVHFRPFHIPSNLRCITMLRPYRCGNAISLFTQSRKLSLLHCINCCYSVQKDTMLPPWSSAMKVSGAIHDCGSFGWVLGTDHESYVWECKIIARRENKGFVELNPRGLRLGFRVSDEIWGAICESLNEEVATRRRRGRVPDQEAYG